MGKTRTPGWGSSFFAVSALAALLAAGPAKALQYPTIYAFGDSLTDAGNVWKGSAHLEPISPPYSQGRFSNGPIWLQDLGVALGLGTIKASLLGGTDFANGGATSGQTSVHALDELDLPAQLIEFKMKVAHPKVGALYAVWIGSNDLLAILDRNLTPAQASAVVDQVVANEETFIAGLVLRGAKNLLVLTVPDLGATPDISERGAVAVKTARALAVQFNTKLSAKLKQEATLHKLDLKMVDTLSLIDAAVAHPSKFGFTNVKVPCWTGTLTSAKSGKVCASSVVVQDRYLFWDHLHPTAGGHAYLAKTVKTDLTPAATLLVASSR